MCMIGLLLAGGGLGVTPYGVLVFFALAFVRKRNIPSMLIVVVVGLFLGLSRGSVAFNSLSKYHPLFGTNISVIGRIDGDVSYNQLRSQDEFNLSNIRVDTQSLPGRVLVSTRDIADYTRGDTVWVQAKLQPAKGTSRQGYLSSAKVSILRKNTSQLEKMRIRFFTAINQVIPEPYGNLGLGYLIGLRANISSDLSEQLSRTGLTHIIAVSGYNLTIIIQAVRSLLGKRSAFQSVVASMLLLVGFVLVAGGSPSINRAAVVSVCSLLAWYYGRKFKPVLLLLFSGALTAYINPLYIWGDPGWYLSFLAFSGVLIVAPLLSTLFFRRKPASVLASILIETLSAQICTLPYVLYLFGGFSVIAPLANILVLPLIPLIMFLIFITGLVAMIAPGIGSVLAVMPYALLTLQVWIIERLSQVSGAYSELKLSLLATLVLFFLLIIVITVLHYVVHSKITASSNVDMV